VFRNPARRPMSKQAVKAQFSNVTFRAGLGRD
jgi:hypothetical protein